MIIRAAVCLLLAAATLFAVRPTYRSTSKTSPSRSYKRPSARFSGKAHAVKAPATNRRTAATYRKMAVPKSASKGKHIAPKSRPKPKRAARLKKQ
jgi:hypothetical protein